MLADTVITNAFVSYINVKYKLIFIYQYIVLFVVLINYYTEVQQKHRFCYIYWRRTIEQHFMAT